MHILKPPKIFLVDIDDTILHWRKSFFKHMTDNGYKTTENCESKYNLHECFYDIPNKEIDLLVNKFNSDESLFGTLPAMSDAKISLPYLNKELGYRFIAISSCSSDENKDDISKIRLNNLTNEFGDIFDEAICVEIYGSKKEILSKFQPTWWVDDKIMNVIEGHETGHKSFLLHQLWNSNHNTPLNRVNNWYDLSNLVLENHTNN